MSIDIIAYTQYFVNYELSVHSLNPQIDILLNKLYSILQKYFLEKREIIMSIEKVKAYFAGYGLEDRILEPEASSATVEEAARAVGCEPARIAKTMSFLTADGPILIVMAGDARTDNKKFKAEFHERPG